MIREGKRPTNEPTTPELETSVRSTDAAHSNSLTLVSIAVVACAAADMVHEAIGHGLASWLMGDPILSISTVALQNATANRFVAASGTAANLIAGALSLVSLRRPTKFTASVCLLWLFGAFNLFNCGYLTYSALFGSGDWSTVIAGLEPPILWRIMLGVAGAALYVLAIRWTADALLRFVDNGEVALRDVRGWVVVAYVAGGVLMTAASVLNPIGPMLILTSGAGASFGLNFGLLFVPGAVAARAADRAGAGRPISFSPLWLCLALVVAAAFVAILGPGVRFPQPE